MDVLDAREGGAVCQRCHGLRYQNRLAEDLRVGLSNATSLQPEHFVNMLKPISRKRCVVVVVVDLFDFSGSLPPELPEIVGTSNPLVFVANKVDLLPNGFDKRAVERARARE